MITRDSGLLVPEHSVPVETIVRDDAKVLRRAMDICMSMSPHLMLAIVCSACAGADRQALMVPSTDVQTSELELTCGCRRIRLEATYA